MTDWLTILAVALALLVASSQAGCQRLAAMKPGMDTTVYEPPPVPATQPSVKEFRMPLLPPGFEPWPDGWPGETWMYEHGLLLVEG